MADVSRRQLFEVLQAWRRWVAGSRVRRQLAVTARRARAQPGSRSAEGTSASASPAVARRTSWTGRTSSPSPTRPGCSRAFETLLVFDENYQLQRRRPRRERHRRQPQAVHDQACARASSSRTARRSPPTTSSTRLQRIGTQGNGLTGYAATATMDISNMKKVDKYTVSCR